MKWRRLWAIAGWLATAALGFCQLDSNSITVTSSRTLDLRPDQVVFSIAVNSISNTGLDDVLIALQGSGITAANLTSVYGGQEPTLATTGFTQTSGPRLSWTFTMSAPVEQIQTTTASLNVLQQSIAQKNNGLSLTFNVQNAHVSARLQQQDQCPTADLVVDAQVQARKMADAAGLTAGPILTISDQPAASYPALAFSEIGSFAFGQLQSGVGLAAFLLGPTGYTTTASTSQLFAPSLYCAIAVKFQLLRYQ